MELIARNTPNYRGFDLNFTAHPVSGDLAKVSGVEAVKRSIRNLMMTNFYERKYRHKLGSGINASLFENMTSDTMNLLIDKTKAVIQNYEPRATILQISANPDPSENGVIIEIVFRVKNVQDPVTFTVFLERIR